MTMTEHESDPAAEPEGTARRWTPPRLLRLELGGTANNFVDGASDGGTYDGIILSS